MSRRWTKQPRKPAAARSLWGHCDISIATVSSYQIRSISISKGFVFVVFLLCFVLQSWRSKKNVVTHVSNFHTCKRGLTSHHPRVTELKSLLRPSPMSRVSCWGQVQLYLTRFFLATCLICRNLCFSMCCLCHPYRPGVRERCSLQCGWRACLMLSLMGRWGFCQTHLFWSGFDQQYIAGLTNKKFPICIHM